MPQESPANQLLMFDMGSGASYKPLDLQLGFSIPTNMRLSITAGLSLVLGGASLVVAQNTATAGLWGQCGGISWTGAHSLIDILRILEASH